MLGLFCSCGLPASFLPGSRSTRISERGRQVLLAQGLPGTWDTFSNDVPPPPVFFTHGERRGKRGKTLAGGLFCPHPSALQRESFYKMRFQRWTLLSHLSKTFWTARSSSMTISNVFNNHRSERETRAFVAASFCVWKERGVTVTSRGVEGKDGDAGAQAWALLLACEHPAQLPQLLFQFSDSMIQSR